MNDPGVRTAHEMPGDVPAIVRSVQAGWRPPSSVSVNGTWLDWSDSDPVIELVARHYPQATRGFLFYVKTPEPVSDQQLAGWLVEHLTQVLELSPSTMHGRPLPSGVHPSRVMMAIRKGGEAFWNCVAEAFPECGTGDHPLADASEFSRLLDLAVSRWLITNWPEPADDDSQTGGDAS